MLQFRNNKNILTITKQQIYFNFVCFSNKNSEIDECSLSNSSMRISKPITYTNILVDQVFDHKSVNTKKKCHLHIEIFNKT